MSTDQAHSEELFVITRDFWWNTDFMELMARRWHLESVRSVLDVGSGLGHWGRTLLPHLHSETLITGIDPEAKWVTEAGELAEKSGLSGRLKYQLGKAENLPFNDNSFDFVTCQTMLVHIADVHKALQEMIRVLKPGGQLVAVEPNNLALSLLLGSTRLLEDQTTTLGLVQLQLVCEHGKKNLGEGYNSVGDLIPGYLNELGLNEISVYQSDHATPLVPPYADLAQRANRDELIDLAKRDIYIWNRTDAKRYFLAGGGKEAVFNDLWKLTQKVSKAIAKGLRDYTEHQAGGSVFYLVSGRKPFDN